MTTVIVARLFRGQVLYFTGENSASALCWQSDRRSALRMDVGQAKHIIARAQNFSGDTNAYAIDERDEIIVPAESNAAKPYASRAEERRANRQKGHAHLGALVVLFLLAVALVCCSGCVTLAPGADNVALVHDASAVSKCRALGPVGSGMGAAFMSTDLDYPRKNVMNQAAALGGDTVLLTGAVPLQGVAYKCGGAS